MDYEPFSSVYASDIRRLHLACDGEIEWSKLEEFRRDYLFKRAMNKAVNSIKFSDKCEYDIRQKLKDLYYDEEIVDQTIDKLKSYGYIDDYRYACGYVRRNSAKKGIRVIRFELQAKHIGQDIIDLAVEDSDISDESDRITYILQKKYTVEELTEKVLHNARVFITPGFIFGSNGKRYIRISLCCKDHKLEEALKRIREMK